MADQGTLSSLLRRAETLHGQRRQTPLQTDLFDEQSAFIADKARKKVALCSRRSGKTVCASYALAVSLEESDLDDVIVYAAKTRSIAKGLIWNKLKEVQRKWDLPWQFREVDLQVITKGGGMIQLTGLDKEAEIDKLRGIRARLVVLDEPATYSNLIGRLVAEVIEPALGDLRGSLLVVGTPGIICAGWWHDVSTGKTEGYSVHSWTILQNPYFPDPEQYLRQRRAENDWDENHPTFLREDRGEWVQDDGDLIYKFTRDRNVCADIPIKLDEFTIGCDFGVNDASAWVILGWQAGDSRCFVLEAHKHAGMLPDEAAAFTAGLVARYRPRRLVGDSQGLGKPYVEQFNRRYDTGLTMLCAEKSEKRAHIELLNGEMRTGRLQILQGAANPLLDEIAILGWNAKRTDSHPGLEDHAADAMLYAWRHSTAYRDRLTAVSARTDIRDVAQILEEEDEQLAAGGEREWWDDQRWYG